MHTPTTFRAMFCLSTALFACDSGESKPTPGEAPKSEPVKADVKSGAKADIKVEPVVEAPKTEAPPAATTPAAAAGAAGPAYFAVDKKGVIKLENDKFTLLGNSPDKLMKGLQIAGDGALWVVGFEDILRLEGDKFKKVTSAGFSELGSSIDDFAVTADGKIWAATFKGVGYWDGKTWAVEDKAKIGAGDDLLQGIAVDKAGNVWVASTHKVHVKTGGAWKDVALDKAGQKRQLFFEALDLAPDGSVYALASAVLLRIGPAADALATVKLGDDDLPSWGDLAISSNGSIAARNLDDVSALPAGGAARTWSSRNEKDFRADNIRAVGVDDSGRVWVGSDAGVSVVGPGDAKVEWPQGSVPELIGEVGAIVVVGSGPATLPASGAVRKGGLTGKLVRDGAALPNVDVEICPSPGMVFTKSPCADAATKFSGKADDKGVWTFNDVPLGSYGIAVKIEGKWQITFGHSLGEGMKEGQVFDTGSITLDSKK
jgi:ligand-binding sensor domain-containing protein